jgi:hypothetical protein
MGGVFRLAMESNPNGGPKAVVNQDSFPQVRAALTIVEYSRINSLTRQPSPTPAAESRRQKMTADKSLFSLEKKSRRIPLLFGGMRRPRAHDVQTEKPGAMAGL